MKSFLLKYIGPKSFYQQTIRVAIPLAMTMLLSSCMSIIDSIMVSSIGMVTAVGNASQFLTLHDCIMWGVTSGIAIYAAQFFGADQYRNMTKTLGLCIIMTLANSFFWTFLVFCFSETILLFYLDDLALLPYSQSYLYIAILSTIPSSFNQAFGVMYRSSHNTRLPFIMSVIGGVGNVIFNYLFIFVLDFGVAGAAIGTLISQIIVLLCYVGEMWLHKPVFFTGFKDLFSIDFNFAKPILKKGLPLIINETFFGFGSTLFIKAFGTLGTSSMDAYYIANQVFNMFTFAVHGYGGAVSILIGTRLGAGRIEQAKEESNYQLGLGLVLGVVLVGVMLLFKDLILMFFSITDEAVYNTAGKLLSVFSIKVFLRMFNYLMFSTLRAGGDAKIMNFLDAGIMYLVGIPLAFISIYVGIEDIVLVLLICQIEQLVRFVFTMHRYKRNIWAKDLTKVSV